MTNPIKVDPFSRWDGGISDYDKDGLPNEYAFGRSIDHRTDPRKIKLLPKTTKESGSIVLGLPKWAERVVNTTYINDAGGNIYSRSSVGSYSLLRNVANSHGNGMAYYGEDDNLYYASDKALGRYGYVVNGTPTFADDFLSSQGGVPTNTNSLTLVAASSRYATAADSASLSITGNITLESYINPASLPAVGSSMTILGKWDESGVTRSYKFDIYAISGFFGDGSDGTKTVSANTTDSPIDSACTGTIATSALSATNVSFAAGQVILIHQTQGTGAGTWQKNTVQGYTAGTITLGTPLNATYGSGAQVLVMKQYTNVTVNVGVTWTAKAWNGTVGGILAFLATGTLTNNGNISADGVGYRGQSNDGTIYDTGHSGEGTGGSGTLTTAANGNGGGGGANGTPGGDDHAGSGSGGGNGTAGSQGGAPFGSPAGTDGAAGSSAGTTDLTTMVFGGAGGTAPNSGVLNLSKGGNGGGIISAFCVTMTLNGGSAITAAGAVGGNAYSSNQAGSGGGAGGSILLKTQTATLGTTLITATGGAGGTGDASRPTGGSGGVGRIHLDYYTSYTGTTNPTLDFAQDNNLVTTTTYQLRIGISNDGTAFEYLAKNVSSGISLAAWHHVAVTWAHTSSLATFYFDKTNIGTVTGTKTAIHDNVSLLYLGANNVSAVQNFFDGKIDEPRIWNLIRSDSDIANNADRELGGTEGGLQGYWQLDNSASDQTGNANNFTLVNSPTYSTDVPFANATTRLDIDQLDSSTGNTYTVPTAIDEGASARQTFVPTKDPQKSIDVKVAAKGTGNWTLTVHDGLNRVIATATATNAQLPVSAGYYEFIFTTPWRPVRGASYHFHLTSTVADGTVTTGTASNLETGNFHSYFQFLVTDIDYHPMQQFINTLVIGNERYLATWDASSYTPHKLTFPSGWRVRCLAQWRDYLAIGCWKGTNMYDYDEGIIFFWDGYSSTYNFYIKVPEGGINAMFSSRGVLYVWAGYQGDMLTYVGGDFADQVKRTPKIAENNYMEIMPGAVNMWKGLLRSGAAGNSDSADIERGVYTYGQRNTTKPKSLTYDYPISTGNRGSTVKVGMIYPVDRKLLIGWQDGTGYGVDVVDPAGAPFASGTVELRIHDYGGVYHEKGARTVRADMLPLLTGESVAVKYKLDRASNWTSLTESTVGATKVRLPIDFGNHKEAQIATDLAQTNGTSPTVLEFTLEEDMKPEELIV